MNLDQLLSTEEDWPQQSWEENDDLEFSSYPLMFGRQANKKKNDLVIEKQDYFIDPYQEEVSADFELNQLLNQIQTPIKKRQIKKTKKIKNTAITNLYKTMAAQILDDSTSQSEILKQLQHCQKMKTIIDGLERTLGQIKGLLLQKVQTRKQ